MQWLPFILGSVVFGVIGQLCLKTGVSSVATSGGLAFLYRALTTPMVLLGFGAYAASSLIWLVVLSKVALSYAYPMVALGYVFVVVASAVILREDVPLVRWVALLIICAGVALLARS